VVKRGIILKGKEGYVLRRQDTQEIIGLGRDSGDEAVVNREYGID